jgi:hypothetical protein
MGQVADHKISDAAIELLRVLAIIPECVGYDHRVRELDEHKPPLIEWLPRHGYTASVAGHQFLVSLPLPSADRRSV